MQRTTRFTQYRYSLITMIASQRSSVFTAEQVLESILGKMSEGAGATEHAFQRGSLEQVLQSMLYSIMN